MAALAKGREIARINREKKKQEFEEKIKLEMKQEMEQLLKSQKVNKEVSPQRETFGVTREARLKEQSNKKQVVEQQQDSEEEELPQEQEAPRGKKVKVKEVAESRVVEKKKHEKEFQPIRVITKQKFQEEAKKIVESSKKKMPIFKDDEKKAPKVKGRLVDFFKPHKVVYVSDSEEEPSE